MFFLGFALAVEHLHMLLIGDAFWSFSDSLRTGQLDFHLLRPIGSIFSVFFSRPRPGAVFDFVIPWSVLIWFGFELALPWYAWMLLPIFALLGIMLRALIELTLAMGMFWIIDGTPINFLRIHLQSISRWPDFAYVPTVRRFFIGILPVLLISSAPVHFLLEGHIWPLLPAMAVAFVVCFFLIRVLWRLGLRRYESASS